MAKSLTLAAALLVALVALAGATTFTTTVTTTTLDEEANQRYRQCSQQVQGRQFRNCQNYLRQRGGGGGGYEEEDSVLEMSTENPRQQQSLQGCCDELRRVDEQCRCEAIRQAVRQAQQGGFGGESERGYGGGQSEQIYQMARSLPRMCHMRPEQCRFHVVLV